MQIDAVNYSKKQYAQDKIEALRGIRTFSEFSIIETDVVQHIDLQALVFESLDNAVINGFDPRETPDAEVWARDLIGLSPDFETFSVESIEPHVEEWLKKNAFPSSPVWQPIETAPVWQPIETAPKDGTVIIIYPAWYRKKVLSAGEAYWYTSVRHSKWKSQNLSIPCEPTHWMPFPPGPKPEL